MSTASGETDRSGPSQAGDAEPVVTARGLAYRWREHWAQWPDDPVAHEGWAHHGLSFTSTGELLAFHPGESRLLRFAQDGRLSGSAPCPVREAHGLVRVTDDGIDHVWIADNAVKSVRLPDGGYGRAASDTPGQVVKVDLEGNLLQKLATPPRPEYDQGIYSPTTVAVDETRLGGSGDIWVGDGYGQSLVHRFAADGTYLATLSGEEGGGRFDCPHAVFIDRRRDQPELYIADRGNARVQVYGLDGQFRRVIGADFLTSPSAFAAVGDMLVISELFAAVALLDEHDQLVGTIGANPSATDRPGWPNTQTDGRVDRAPVREGAFNSPHGIAADEGGSIYVSEWLVGGRLIKLEPVT
ncbi:MAG TPA: hypothetical protein VIP98_03125 [Microlunatus sp.]